MKILYEYLITFCQKRIRELRDLIKEHEQTGSGNEIFRCKGQIAAFSEIVKKINEIRYCKIANKRIAEEMNNLFEVNGL